MRPTLSKSLLLRIRAFKGYVPPPSLAARVVAPPYDVLDTKEARAIAGSNEMCFLRVSRPDLEFPDGTDPYSPAVYSRAQLNLQKFLANGYLVPDEKRRMYIYAQKMENHTQYGVMALSHIEDYACGRIKRHELTRREKEADRTRITDVQGANTGPVFLTYRHRDEIDSMVKDVVVKQEPYAHVKTSDGFEHTRSELLVGEFAKLSCTYIADGHHRAASAYNVGKMRRERAVAKGARLTGEEDFHYFLSILYPDNNLRVLPYNRVLKSFCGNTESEIFAKLSHSYTVTPLAGDPAPPTKRVHSMYLGKRWYRLALRPGLINPGDPVNSLDVEILSQRVLKPIFGISDLRSDKRVDFVGGIRRVRELERRCASDCVCAFAMFPVSVGEIMRVADRGRVMPPKSTWFEPKPRSGFVVHMID